MSESDPFIKMAELIALNAASGTFGGAAVIVPPEGEPIEVLILDSSADPAQFIGAVKTRLDIALASLEMAQKRSR